MQPSGEICRCRTRKFRVRQPCQNKYGSRPVIFVVALSWTLGSNSRSTCTPPLFYVAGVSNTLPRRSASSSCTIKLRRRLMDVQVGTTRAHASHRRLSHPVPEVHHDPHFRLASASVSAHHHVHKHVAIFRADPCAETGDDSSITRHTLRRANASRIARLRESVTRAMASLSSRHLPGQRTPWRRRRG